MRCTGRFTGRFTAFVSMILIGVFVLTGCQTKAVVVEYETQNYNKKLYEETLYADSLCVSSEDISADGINVDPNLSAAALFDVNNKKVSYGYHLHDKIYPASTTKILTALVALKNSKLEDIVTVGIHGAAASFAADAQVCGLQEGDQLTMEALLNGLLLWSGNDSAVAIAEYIAGSSEAFVEMMNQEAQNLMAANTHFVTPNGLHDDNHYTTAYDLYLIFNECIKQKAFVDIISRSSYTADVTGADGSVRQIVWEATNFYAKGTAESPTGASVIGGKTGYTEEAKDCLILLEKDENDNPYISIVMGAESKPAVYVDMNAMINQIPNLSGSQ